MDLHELESNIREIKRLFDIGLVDGGIHDVGSLRKISIKLGELAHPEEALRRSRDVICISQR